MHICYECVSVWICIIQYECLRSESCDLDVFMYKLMHTYMNTCMDVCALDVAIWMYICLRVCKYMNV